MTNELQQACFDVARITKWARKPVDSAEITALGEKLFKIAQDQVSPELEIDLPLIARAVRYLGQVHAIPPMDDNTVWFSEMLRAVLEIARPNTGVNDENKEFLRDMLHGIKDLLRNNLVSSSGASGSGLWCNSIPRESREETCSRWRVANRRL